ncbi:MAG: hypothetical protein GY856_31040, partial [bacterium]|nr:hypothetical protein [bacterium]
MATIAATKGPKRRKQARRPREDTLASKEGANTLNGDGKLQRQKPLAGDHFDSYTYDPGEPTPSLFYGAASSYDSLVNHRKDVLV